MHRHLIAGAVLDAAGGKSVLVVSATQPERAETFAELTQHAQAEQADELHRVIRTRGLESLRFATGGRIDLVTVRAVDHFGAGRRHADVVIVDSRGLRDDPAGRAALLGELVPSGAEIIGLEPWLLLGGAS